MRHFTFPSLQTMLLTSAIFFGAFGCIQDHLVQSPTSLTAVPGPPFATGLKFPIGITDDPAGNVWVTEAGSGTASDGQVTVITPSGKAYPAVTGFVSEISPENSPAGLNHLLYKDGKLYILHGVEDKLYIVDVSGFVPGVSAPIEAKSLTGIDIGTFVKKEHPNAPDVEDSNPFNLTFGPDGDLFITDSGANAVIRREKATGNLSVYMVFADVPNPTYPSAPVGPPTIDAVPTGIVYDGTSFYVSTLVGFPFPTGLSKIYKFAATKAPLQANVYKSGFSGITDIAFSPGGRLMASEFGFSTPGRIASGEDASVNLFAPAITPVDIHLSTAAKDTYYVLYYGPGIITKFTAAN
jgi:hypothetical protein